MKAYKIYADRVKGILTILGFFIVIVLIVLAIVFADLPWYAVTLLLALGALVLYVMFHFVRRTFTTGPLYIANAEGIQDFTGDETTFYKWTELSHLGMKREEGLVIDAEDLDGNVVVHIDGRNYRLQKLHHHYKELRKRALQSNPEIEISDYVNKLEVYLDKKQAREERAAAAEKRAEDLTDRK